MSMIRFRALARYKRHYLHAIRNGKGSEQSADEAMTRTKAEVNSWLEEDKSVDEFSKREIWGGIFSVLIEWQALLDDVSPTATPKALGIRVAALDAVEKADKEINSLERKDDRNKVGVSSSNNPRSGDTDNRIDSGSGQIKEE
jgi:hypothetical protein